MKSFIPNATLKLKSKVIFNGGLLGVSFKIKVAAGLQTNASNIFDLFYKNNLLNVGLSCSLGKNLSFSGNVSFKRNKIALSLAFVYSLGEQGAYVGVYLELGVHYLTAVAIAGCCVAAPYLGSFMGSVMGALSASMATLGKAMVVVTPKLIYCLT